jgi:hypothetical protein
MVTTVKDVLEDLAGDAWDNWNFETGNPVDREHALYLEELKHVYSEDGAMEVGWELGVDWAPQCQTQIDVNCGLPPYEQLKGETFPSLFEIIKSKIETEELAAFCYGFGRGVSDHQHIP